MVAAVRIRTDSVLSTDCPLPFVARNTMVENPTPPAVPVIVRVPVLKDSPAGKPLTTR